MRKPWGVVSHEGNRKMQRLQAQSPVKHAKEPFHEI